MQQNTIHFDSEDYTATYYSSPDEYQVMMAGLRSGEPVTVTIDERTFFTGVIQSVQAIPDEESGIRRVVIRRKAITEWNQTC